MTENERTDSLTGKGSDNPGEVITAIRELHRPHWYDPLVKSGQVWLVCGGCDEGAHAEDPPPWPCRTADLVYTAAEISAREPHVPECPEDHRTIGTGPPVQAKAVFLRPLHGDLLRPHPRQVRRLEGQAANRCQI